MSSSMAIRRPVSILLAAIFALLVVGIGSPSVASARTQQWKDRQQIADLREDAAVARKQGWLFFGTAVLVVTVGIAVTVATGGAAGPAVAAGVISLVSGGAGVDRFIDAKASDRKADTLQREYRQQYGQEP